MSSVLTFQSHISLKVQLCLAVEVPNFGKAVQDILQEVRVTRELSHPNIVKVVGASTRGQADILHNLTSEVLIVFPLYQVDRVVHSFFPPSIRTENVQMQRSLQDELESREKSGNHFPDPILLSLFLRICQVFITNSTF